MGPRICTWTNTQPPPPDTLLKSLSFPLTHRITPCPFKGRTQLETSWFKSIFLKLSTILRCSSSSFNTAKCQEHVRMQLRDRNEQEQHCPKSDRVGEPVLLCKEHLGLDTSSPAVSLTLWIWLWDWQVAGTFWKAEVGTSKWHQKRKEILECVGEGEGHGQSQEGGGWAHVEQMKQW